MQLIKSTRILHTTPGGSTIYADELTDEGRRGLSTNGISAPTGDPMLHRSVPLEPIDTPRTAPWWLLATLAAMLGVIGALFAWAIAMRGEVDSLRIRSAVFERIVCEMRLAQ